MVRVAAASDIIRAECCEGRDKATQGGQSVRGKFEPGTRRLQQTTRAVARCMRRVLLKPVFLFTMGSTLRAEARDRTPPSCRAGTEVERDEKMQLDGNNERPDFAPTHRWIAQASLLSHPF